MKSCRIFLLAFCFFLVSCTATGPRAQPATDAPPADPASVKNIILIIADGMGPQQVGLLLEYAHKAPGSIYADRPTAVERLAAEGTIGIAATTPEEALVVDSACSATHLATGQPAPLEALGVDRGGHPVRTILELARDRGKSTGLVSDTRITHATPAAFASHIAHRSMENEIALQMLGAGVDVLFSGGLRHFLPAGVNNDEALRSQFEARIGQAFPISSRRSDDLDLLSLAEKKGYELVFERDTLATATGPRVLGLFSNSGMLDAIEERRTREHPERREPTLHEMSLKALDILSENEKGFFLMIEAGQVDWAAHNNDTGTLLHEMLRMDETLGLVHQWANGRDDTLIILTADHETGGFGFSYSGANIPVAQPRSGEVFSERLYRPDYNFGSPEVFEPLLAQSASFTHIFNQFDALEKQTPEALQQLVNAHVGFPISLDEAERILKRSPNRLHHDDHPYLTAETLPHIDDFHEYYVYGDEIRKNLLGRTLASRQNVVWSTGTHTHTPVPVIAWGPEAVTRHFDRFMHLMDVGQIMQEVFTED